MQLTLFETAPSIETRDHADGVVWHLVAAGIDQTALIYHRPGESRVACRARAVRCAGDWLREVTHA